MWTEKRLERLSGFSARDFADWFQAGIRDWTFEDSRHRKRAFSPVADAFDPSDDAEYQVFEMFEALPGKRQIAFSAGLSIVFHEAPATEAGYELFRAAQICLEYLDRPGIAVAMVDRLIQPGFLDNASDEWREELFALAIVLLRKMFRMSDLSHQIARLRSRRELFRDDFVPAVIGMVLDREPASLGRIVGVVAPWRLADPAIQVEAVEAVTSRLARWPWMQVQEALERADFADLIRPYNGDDADQRYAFALHCLSERVKAEADATAMDVDLATFIFDCRRRRGVATTREQNADVASRMHEELDLATAVEGAA